MRECIFQQIECASRNDLLSFKALNARNQKGSSQIDKGGANKTKE